MVRENLMWATLYAFIYSENNDLITFQIFIDIYLLQINNDSLHTLGNIQIIS